MQGKIDIRLLVQGLNARIEELCAQILPNGRRDGREWLVGSVAGEPGKSCRICLYGDKRGIWSDFSSDEKGDAFDLVAEALFHGNKGQALRWSKAWLGMDGDDERSLARTRRAVAEAQEAPSQDETALKSRKWARNIFLNARPDIADTPVESYLRGRGIDIRRHLARYPRSLRFAPDLYNRESKRSWPALVAAICDGTGEMVAVHRIWLQVHADGRVSKAPLKDPKMTLGRIQGGSVRIWKGASGKPLAKAPVGSSCVLAEGLEDSLVLAMARPEERYLATISLSNLGTVDLPAQIARVTLYLDNDRGSERKMKHIKTVIERVIARHRQAGREVLIARPPEQYKDANDLLLGAVA